jgi:hypothetical protein
MSIIDLWNIPISVGQIISECQFKEVKQRSSMKSMRAGKVLLLLLTIVQQDKVTKSVSHLYRLSN